MAVKETLLQKLETQARRNNLAPFSKQSYAWFRNQVRSIGGNKARKELMNNTKINNNFRNIPKIGQMYSFVYDAKGKGKLPYWDSFPLILLIGPAEDGFYGLNLHYLPPKARAVLFDRLLDLSSDSRYDDKTKIRLSYQLLQGASRYKLFEPCLKRYLYSQLQSRFAFIPASEWEAVLFLPTADFQGASNSKVWSESILKV